MEINMNNQKIRVAVNGFGVIGKRVADAVRLQPDMELVGVADVVSDYRVKTAVVLNLPIFASLPEKVSEMAADGIPVVGTLNDLLRQSDVVVDCTPKGIGAKNLDVIPLPERHLKDDGDKVCFRGVMFTDCTGWVSPRCVEIAQ